LRSEDCVLLITANVAGLLLWGIVAVSAPAAKPD